MLSKYVEAAEKKTKRDYEKNIAEEQKYSEKYGVLNLRKMEQYKQGIMRADNALKVGLPIYKKENKKKFTIAECKNIAESYKDYLDKATQEFMRKHFIESLRAYDEEKRNYILKYIEGNFPGIGETKINYKKKHRSSDSAKRNQTQRSQPAARHRPGFARRVSHTLGR